MTDSRPALDDISIRTDLRPGDLGYITHIHGRLYGAEYGYGISFETYVGLGLHEFYQQYDPRTNRGWICEHRGIIVGFILLMNRGRDAQLRYFLLEPAYRGIGLGGKLMRLYMEFLHSCGYQSSYLWTTSDLIAAASLYRRHGFALVEEKDSTAFGKPLKEQKYALHLSH